MKKYIALCVAVFGMIAVQVPAASADINETKMGYTYYIPCQLNTVNWQARGCSNGASEEWAGKIVVSWATYECGSTVALLDLDITGIYQWNSPELLQRVANRVGQYMSEQYGFPLTGFNYAQPLSWTSVQMRGFVQSGLNYCPGRAPGGGVPPAPGPGGGTPPGGTSGGGGIIGGGGGGLIR